MKSGSLDRAIPPGERLLLDSSALIAYLGGNDPATPVATYVVDEFVRPGRNPAIVSMVSVMELLVRPLRLGAREPYQHALDFLKRFPNLQPVQVDLHAAHEAASLRATHNLKPADALIVATGLVSQVGHLVTNDGALATKLNDLQSRIRVCRLADYLLA
jgi:predicted nucleic acid-binding protein